MNAEEIEDIKKISLITKKINDNNSELSKLYVFRKNGDSKLYIGEDPEGIELLGEFLTSKGIKSTGDIDLDEVKKICELVEEVEKPDKNASKDELDKYEAYLEKINDLDNEIDDQYEDIYSSSDNDLDDDIEDDIEDNDSEDDDVDSNDEDDIDDTLGEEPIIPENEIDDEEENIDEETLNKKKLSKKTKAAIAAGVVAVGGIGAYHIYKNRDKDDNKDNEYNKDSEFYNLLSQYDEDSLEYKFFDGVFGTTATLNLMTSKDDAAVIATKQDGSKVYAFSLDTDVSTDDDGKQKDEYLEFTFDEVVAAKLALNNYSSEELYALFGDSELSLEKIKNDYESFIGKMQIYYMNAQKSSGVAELIEDETNKKWFENLENQIIAFNKDVSLTNSNKVIRLFEYFYEYDINGTDNVKSNSDSINAIKNLGYNMVTGFYNANAADNEYTKYLVVSNEPGDFDNKYQSEKLAQVQKGEKLKDILERAKSGNCATKLVFEHFEQMSNKLMEIQSERNSKNDILKYYSNNLLEALIQAGKPELASNVLNGDIEQVRDEIKKVGKEARVALKAYDNANNLQLAPSFEQLREAANNELGPYSELNFTVLFTNRQRGKTLELNKDDEKYITKNKWDNMSKKEQLEYAKKNGTVQSKTTKTTEKQVSYNELTPSEQKEADKQLDELKKKDSEVKIDDSGDVVKVEFDSSTYKGQGVKDGETWATSGEYKYSGTIECKTNPDAKTIIYNYGKDGYPVSNNYYDIAVNLYAYEGKKLPSTLADEELRRHCTEAGTEYREKLSNLSEDEQKKALEAYLNGWLTGVDATLKAAVKSGTLKREEAEKLYNDAKKAADSKSQEVVEENNNSNNTSNNTNNEKVVVKESDNYVASEVPVNNESDGKFVGDNEQNASIDNDVFIDDDGKGFHYTTNGVENFVPVVEETVKVEEPANEFHVTNGEEVFVPIVEEKSQETVSTNETVMPKAFYEALEEASFDEYEASEEGPKLVK